MAYNQTIDTYGVRKNATEILKRVHGLSNEEIQNGMVAFRNVVGISAHALHETMAENTVAEIVLAFLGDKPRNKK